MNRSLFFYGLAVVLTLPASAQVRNLAYGCADSFVGYAVWDPKRN